MFSDSADVEDGGQPPHCLVVWAVGQPAYRLGQGDGLGSDPLGKAYDTLGQPVQWVKEESAVPLEFDPVEVRGRGGFLYAGQCLGPAACYAGDVRRGDLRAERESRPRYRAQREGRMAWRQCAAVCKRIHAREVGREVAHVSTADRQRKIYAPGGRRLKAARNLRPGAAVDRRRTWIDRRCRAGSGARPPPRPRSSPCPLERQATSQ
eukprot:GHVT01011138.1.p1 GENE.GHVT01011138.1~~GHVT01011138.1.p1  ORF type:complete len:207 (+),score=19.37 GHVT01011138.1:237-857(+)